jgi:hypothetical protein
MKIHLPLRLDTEAFWTRPGQPSEPIRVLRLEHVATGGWFTDHRGRGVEVSASAISGPRPGARHTHLVSVVDGEVLKRCPCCEVVLSSPAFGIAGRYGGRQDQSHCPTCRQAGLEAVSARRRQAA